MHTLRAPLRVGPEERYGPMFKAFCGRLYFNLAQVRHLCALNGTAPAEILRSMGHAAEIDPADEKPSLAPVSERLSVLPDMLRLVWRDLRAPRLLRDLQQMTSAMQSRLTAADPRSLTSPDVWAVLEDWWRNVPETMKTVLMLSGVVFHEAPVRKLCAKVGLPFEQVVYPQLAVGERSISAQQAFDLVSLAEQARGDDRVIKCLEGELPDLKALRQQLEGTPFLAAFERFLAQYGHRGLYESDWALPRYSEDPTPLLEAIRMHLQTETEVSSSVRARQQQAALDAWTMFEQRLTRSQRWTVLPRVRRGIRTIKQYYVWREQVRFDLIKILSSLRVWHLALADRFVSEGWIDRSDDYFLLELREVGAAIRDRRHAGALRQIVERRTAERERNRALTMPLLMHESDLARLIRTAAVNGAPAESQLSGHPVSGGVVEAEVVVVHDPGDFSRMRRGAILVARATDPSWTPLFTLASGVIVEVGGVLSHASTIAREYGLPALANVRRATRTLKTGERVRLDALRGVVERIGQVARAAA